LPLGAGSGFFPMFNRNKKSVAIDLRHPQGAEVARKLEAIEPDAVLSFLTQTNVLTVLATRGLNTHTVISERNDPRRLFLSRETLMRHAAAHVTEERFPTDVEVAAYYVIAEGLTNIARYANATEARVDVTALDGRLHVTVADNGRGGADPATGSGLRGLADRVAAIGGDLDVASPSGAGTTLTAWLPTGAALSSP
jgi:glucose-6-phosphate-specific signal transduction histidine kinase